MRQVDRSARHGITILPWTDPRYPEPYRDLKDAPPFIYTQGELPADWQFAAAVVGTREPSDFAVEMARRVVAALATESRAIVVSGLANGIDTVAHIAALENGIRTVAVLANGLDSVYPKGNTELAERILSRGGCLISETPTGTGVTKYGLVARDRLQSGLARATFAMQTSFSGGTMHTALSALQQSRTLVALKPPMDDVAWSGNAFLLGLVRDEWLQQRSMLEKFMELPTPWAYALTEARLESFVERAIASGFVARPRLRTDRVSQTPSAEAPSLLDAMNVPQERMQSLLNAVEGELRAAVPTSGFSGFRALPPEYHPPEDGMAQSAVWFSAIKNDLTLTLGVVLLTPENASSGAITDSGLSLFLRNGPRDASVGRSMALSFGDRARLVDSEALVRHVQSAEQELSRKISSAASAVSDVPSSASSVNDKKIEVGESHHRFAALIRAQR